MTQESGENPNIWEIVVELPSRQGLADFEAALENITIGISSLEVPGTPKWRLTGYCMDEPSRPQVESLLLGTRKGIQNEISSLEIRLVEERDWVAETEQSLGPIHVGPYFVHGSHVITLPPTNSIAIRIDAGMAFGTGNHETTRGCLWAIEHLYIEDGPRKPVDVGTGSGILAIALAKRFGIRVVAGDNDPVAIDVAVENARINGVSESISFHVSEGLSDVAIQASIPFDLVIANIVANPLIEMTGEISQAIAPEGHVILSGILSEQAEEVLNHYQQHGFTFDDRLIENEWETLILSKKG
jgi:ribosomal protein L11 methyltransferase